jgi:hypothetical protein
MGRRTIKNDHVHVYDVIVIGAGFSGVFAALELAKKEEVGTVLLLERGASIIGPQSSSRNECYKLHTGLHYAGDEPTAIKCLNHSVIFARETSEAILGKVGEPWRRGVHYIMSSSLYTPEEVRSVCDALRETYQKAVDEYNGTDNALKEIFGPPEDFIKELGNREDDFPHIAEKIRHKKIDKDGKATEETSQVVLALESAESQIDIDKIVSDLSAKIKANEKITFLPHRQVKKISSVLKSLDSEVEAVDISASSSPVVYRGRYIVNCTWEQSEKLDRASGDYLPSNKPNEQIVIRMKATILVTLPEELKNRNTCIFSIGPYVSVTNLGNGTAIIAEENLTNIGYFTPGNEPDEGDLALFLKENKTKEEETCANEKLTERGKAILEASAKYIPALAQAKIQEVRIGFVKMLHTNGKVDPYGGKGTPIHKRREEGIDDSIAFGRVTLLGIKMTYTVGNAIKVGRMFQNYFMMRAELSGSIKTALERVKKELADEKQTGDGHAAVEAEILEMYIYTIVRNYIYPLMLKMRNSKFASDKDEQEYKLPQISANTNAHHELPFDNAEQQEDIPLEEQIVKYAKERFINGKKLNSAIKGLRLANNLSMFSYTNGHEKRQNPDLSAQVESSIQAQLG